jgi:hypothetical protein
MCIYVLELTFRVSLTRSTKLKVVMSIRQGVNISIKMMRNQEHAQEVSPFVHTELVTRPEPPSREECLLGGLLVLPIPERHAPTTDVELSGFAHCSLSAVVEYNFRFE